LQHTIVHAAPVKWVGVAQDGDVAWLIWQIKIQLDIACGSANGCLSFREHVDVA
jgi:hypothetical protein